MDTPQPPPKNLKEALEEAELYMLAGQHSPPTKKPRLTKEERKENVQKANRVWFG